MQGFIILAIIRTEKLIVTESVGMNDGQKFELLYCTCDKNSSFIQALEM